MELSFRRVSKGSPCPQCGKPDWCTVGDYGVVCHAGAIGQAGEERRLVPSV